MPLDQEEIDYWQERRLTAKTKLREIAPMRKALKKLLEKYDKIHCRYFIMYQQADEKLAFEDGRFRVVTGQTSTTKRDPSLLSKDELESLIKALEQIAEGIGFAHSKGIVHRAVKPTNVHVQPGGGVKIMDFGLAGLASPANTQSVMLMGALNYMSPEQVRDEAMDAASDVFSLGAVNLLAILANGWLKTSSAFCLLKEPRIPILVSQMTQIRTFPSGSMAYVRCPAPQLPGCRIASRC